MSKIHSTVNKQTSIGLLIMFGVFVLAIINLVVLLPKLTAVYKPLNITQTTGSIDTQVVSQAMEIVGDK